MSVCSVTVVVLVLIGSAPAQAPDHPRPDDIDTVLAQHVTQIFKTHCIDCHGPHLTRPKGKFGYLLDLGRVTANPDIIVPFEPDNSTLFMLVDDGDMPPPDSDAPPLSESSKKTIRLWISAGAPAVDADASASIQTPGAQTRRLATGWRLVRWLGRLHPASVHLPIGLLLAAAVAEIFLIATRRQFYEHAGRFCIAVATLTAVVTAALGWANGEFVATGPDSAWILLTHRWVGTAAAAWSVLTWWFGESRSRHNSPGRQTRYRYSLFAGALLITVAGFFGGSLVYGLNHYRW